MNKRYKMLFDWKTKRERFLGSNKVYALNEKEGNELIKKGKAVEYNLDSCNRVVSVDGKEMVWGDYLKYKRGINNDFKGI